MVDDASRILAGRYEVGEVIGRGGMAEVHIGHDTRLGRTVAIKILRSDLARDPSFLARFRREAQASAGLNHPSIVGVHDTGEDLTTEPTGVVSHVPFIVMEYVEGHTVRDILRDGQAVPIEEAVEITAGVLSALGYSHHAGIVHRDIKPANVMLTPTGAVKVMDFGIARAIADSAATMTQTQAVIGTAQYLSPEQARGEQVDARSDLYSTGCLLFELLTGRPPFTGDSAVAVAYQHVREQAPTPSSLASDVPDSLDRITLKALAKDRDDRYSTAAEFRADLESAMRGGQVSAPAVGVLTTSSAEAGVGQATQVLTRVASDTQNRPADTSVWDRNETPGFAALVPPEDEPRPRRALLWTLIVIALAAVAGIIALLALNGDRTAAADTVRIPSLVNFTGHTASSDLTALGLVPRREVEASDTVRADLVTRTEPAAGEDVKVGSSVTTFISSGPDQVTVPDVTGQPQDEARAALKAAGLTVGAVLTEDLPVDKGDVTRTKPAADATVPAGQKVTIYIASGQVDVPNLVGKSKADAVATLRLLKLSSNSNSVESTEPPDTVLSQEGGPGLVSQTATITIDVAIAIPPTPTPTPTPTPPTATPTVTIPDDLVGASYTDAAAELTALGLVPERTVVDSDEAPDTVTASDPDAGEQVRAGSTVALSVARGPTGVFSPPTTLGQ